MTLFLRKFMVLAIAVLAFASFAVVANAEGEAMQVGEQALDVAAEEIAADAEALQQYAVEEAAIEEDAEELAADAESAL